MTRHSDSQVDAVVTDDPPFKGRSLAQVLLLDQAISPQLRTLCAILQASHQPMFVLWGKRQQLFFNEPYSATLGERHPSAFGEPTLDISDEITETLKPVVSRAYGGESVHLDDIVLPLVRLGVGQDAHFSISCTPVYGDQVAEVLGVFCVCAEKTAFVHRQESRGEDEASRLRLSDDAPGYEAITAANLPVTCMPLAGCDTTEAAEADKAARDSHARRKEVLDSMGEGFVLLDREFRVLEINAEGVRLDGRPQAAIVGHSHWELWPASIGTPIETNYRRVMTQRVSMQFRHHYISHDHDYCLEVRAYPVKGGIAAFYRDVSAVIRAETELRDSHDRFRAAIEAVGVMWTNDADGRMSGDQPGWVALTGQSRDQYSDFGWARAVHPDDAQPTINAWNDAVAERRLFTFEHRVRRLDGAWRRFAIRAVPVIGQDGSLREWVGVHIDITDAALAAEALRTADRRKDEFLATLAHELRNPLAAMRAAAEILARPKLSNDRIAWAAGVIARQSRIMSTLLNELLDMSRIRSGSIALRPEPVELSSLIDMAVETISHLLEAKGHELAIRLPDAPLFLQVDRLRTTQVIINLLANAAKYTDPGGKLAVVAASSKGFACIDVIDNGIGLASESLLDIFGMFTQVRAASDRSDGGLGIGLTLAKRLVELQDGRIEVSSEGLGRGSVFRIFMPLASNTLPGLVAGQ